MARIILGLATAVLFTVAGASAQVVDLSGEWELEASAFFGPVPEGRTEGLPDCQFSGSATIVQDGTDLGGTADLTLDTGAQGCPAEMSADVDGTFDGTQIQMGLLMGGNLGTAQWDGSLIVEGSEGETDGGFLGLGGDFVVDTGPFAGTDGFWSGQLVGGGPSVLEIPTLTTLGVVALVALLLGAAALMLRRRSTAGA